MMITTRAGKTGDGVCRGTLGGTLVLIGTPALVTDSLRMEVR